MLTKKIAIAAIAGTALLAASGAYARDDHRRGHGPQARFEHRHHGHHHFRHAPRFVARQVLSYYYAPQPVYYAPPWGRARTHRPVVLTRSALSGFVPSPDQSVIIAKRRKA